MGSLRKALIVVAMLGAGAGVGSALFALVTPGELQKQAMLKVTVCWSPGVEAAAAANLGQGTETSQFSLFAGHTGAGPAAQG